MISKWDLLGGHNEIFCAAMMSKKIVQLKRFLSLKKKEVLSQNGKSLNLDNDTEKKRFALFLAVSDLFVQL